MLRLLTDEDVPRSVVRALRQRQPDLEILRVQEIGLDGTADPSILERAAAVGRIVITRDRQTMIGHAYERVNAGQSMPGLIVWHEDMNIGQAVEQIMMVAHCCGEAEVQNRVIFLPL